MYQKGFAHLLPLLVVLAALLLLGYYLVSKGNISVPFVPSSKKEPTVELKTDYKNPFAKETQYVNPFDQYKSPILNLQ